MGRLPKPLMRHSINHYAVSFTKEAGAKVSTTSETPTNQGVPCNFQEATSQVLTLYLQRKEVVRASCFLLDGAVYAAINIKDRIKFEGKFFRVAGKQNLCNLNKVYRLDLSEEVA